IGLGGGENEKERVVRGGEGAVFIHSKPARGPRFPIHPPRRHPGVERGLEGWDQLLKLVERQAREIQERHRAGLQLGKPYTSHGLCLLSRYRDLRGASYQKESGINSAVEGRSTLELRPETPGVQNYYDLANSLIAYGQAT